MEQNKITELKARLFDVKYQIDSLTAQYQQLFQDLVKVSQDSAKPVEAVEPEAPVEKTE